MCNIYEGAWLTIAASRCMGCEDKLITTFQHVVETEDRNETRFLSGWDTPISIVAFMVKTIAFFRGVGCCRSNVFRVGCCTVTTTS